MLYHIRELNLTAKQLVINGNIAGIIIGEDQYGTVIIQIAKCDITYHGSSVALFKLFLSECFTECRYVNFMEDMGLEGLRKAKLSYHPDHFIHKSILESRA